ncbi:hypothetical protein [Persicitalea jodogahamensis]|uniref:Uncharacterized protein n=1 Tax=Persicitalea jodogahamensis TaxID=402147 RepID=A0A8J3G7E7_9BACT|nr:hypothetical protein [Persicitalea jodogahamensis]GHB54630.1 hypothetical protein GCM10007390_04630 [Persicitalea jodogahamensis]
MKYQSLLTLLLAFVCLSVFGQQKIVVEKAGQGGKKTLDFSKVRADIAQNPDPIPGLNDDMKFNQIISMEILSLEGSMIVEAYLNSTNGVFGYSGEMIRVGWKNAPQMEETDHIKFVAHLPNADALMYTETPDMGKIAMKMGSGMSMVSANFDRWNGSQIFWNGVRKTGNSRRWPHEQGLLLEEYKITDEGKTYTCWMHDWGVKADHPLAKNYIATAFGVGYLYNEKNKQLYYLHEINDGINGIAVLNIIPLDASAPKGSYLSRVPFSGKGYKPIGEYLAKEMGISNANLDQNVATEKQKAAEEENPELRRIKMQQAEKMGRISENLKENNGQFLESSDLADLAKAYTNPENQVSMWQIMDLQFQARNEEIQEELSDSNLEPEQRKKLNKQKACLANQQRVLETFRTREKNIKKKYEKGDPDDKMPDEIQTLYQQYASESAKACPE